MSKLVLGLHGFSAHNKRLLHDTGVALVSKGNIISAINEERLSRIKHDGHFPEYSLNKIFELSNINSNDIEAIAFPDKKSIWQTANIVKNIFKVYQETSLFLDKYLITSLKRALDYKRLPPPYLMNKPRYYIEHHLCHAASAYYNCPWDDVAIITLDGMGDYCIGGTINTGENGKIKTLYKTNGFYSPGLFYMFITCLLGYKAGRHEGKITGLAAYGDPSKCYDVMSKMISYNPERHNFYSKQVPSELKHATYFADGNIHSDFNKMKMLFIDQKPEDIAAAAQKRLEEIVIDYIKDAIQLTKKKYIVLAGGVFANVKLNGLLMALTEIENIYIHPNMGDGGLAVGAALYTYHHMLNKEKKFHPTFLETVYLGPDYRDVEIEKALKAATLNYQYYHNIEEKIASAIHQGKVVGRFNGRMEYGPRALGNRSILASPIDRSINDELNKRLKRTEFMPFAPSVMEEYAKDIFHDWDESHVAARFMTVTYKVKETYWDQIPAIVHVDNTARPHIVRKHDNPSYHKIINEYQKISGLPVIVNTSFNMHEEPIVCTPDDAIRAFLQNSVDILAIGNFWVEH